MEVELLRKISSKTVIGKVAKPKKQTPLFHVYGIAHKVRSGNSDMGPWTALIGRFEAVRISDGQSYAAPQCFLPEPMSSMIAEQLLMTEDVVDADGKSVTDADGVQRTKNLVDSIRFSLEIGVKKSDSPVGYEYTTKPHLDPSEQDALADLRKLLPAPKK